VPLLVALKPPWRTRPAVLIHSLPCSQLPEHRIDRAKHLRSRYATITEEAKVATDDRRLPKRQEKFLATYVPRRTATARHRKTPIKLLAKIPGENFGH
jgi:hypothetical protein